MTTHHNNAPDNSAGVSGQSHKSSGFYCRRRRLVAGVCHWLFQTARVLLGYRSLDSCNAEKVLRGEPPGEGTRSGRDRCHTTHIMAID